MWKRGPMSSTTTKLENSMTTATIPFETEQPAATRRCRFCGAGLQRTFVDLGLSPLCETYPAAADFNRGEKYYPLHVYVCEQCWLVQLEEYESAESIFSDYAYFSSFSDSWLEHCNKYCGAMQSRFGLNQQSFVIEVASNDGYLLQYFVKRDVPVLGIEPAANVAKVAVEKGVPTLVQFFGTKLAKRLAAEGRSADLVLGNNVLAQVPDLNDFVEGFKILLKPEGVLTLEFPHLLRLIERNEFDTIYHEHFSYFSIAHDDAYLGGARAEGLRCRRTVNTWGIPSSLRVSGGGLQDSRSHSQRAQVIGDEEPSAAWPGLDGYLALRAEGQRHQVRVGRISAACRQEGKSVAGYGAPGKSATLLHYCGIGKDLIEYTVDRSPYKQGRFLPGSHIPIYHPDRIRETKPDYVVILPWNLKDEIMQQLQFIREWGGRFVVPIPKLSVE